VATRDVWEAREAIADLDRQLQGATGVIRARIQQAQARLARAEARESQLRAELERLEYTLHATGYTVDNISGQRVYNQPEARPTFIVRTRRDDLRARVKELRRLLSERPG
jgi:hypothetical protein